MAYWGHLPNMSVIPNGLSHRPETPADLQAKVVSAIGRYAPQKGLDRLIDAWRLVAGKHPDWQLRLVGDGELREALQEQVDRLNLRDSVLLGKATDDMDSVYRNTSILALSSHYEGLPMVLLEAQAYGIPAVAFTCKCGPRDVITDGVDGILVPEGDIPALAQGLDALISQPDRLREMGTNAFRASERWDFESIMKQWLTLFESTLSSQR
jgi:glycosyltransferase involved in cell wall biosynthesis